MKQIIAQASSLHLRVRILGNIESTISSIRYNVAIW